MCVVRWTPILFPRLAAACGKACNRYCSLFATLVHVGRYQPHERGQPSWTKASIQKYYVTPHDDRVEASPVSERSAWSWPMIRKPKREDESNNGLKARALDRWADEGGASANKRYSDATLIALATNRTSAKAKRKQSRKRPKR